mmetsp:Transcript_23921/g.31134  ORF Transcript_23921/g.31134 Transcript_23921/m.31134 type:complete len:1021 (+) Transcript_23921:52-3114(+)
MSSLVRWVANKTVAAYVRVRGKIEDKGDESTLMGAEYLREAGAGECLDISSRVHLASVVDSAEPPSPRPSPRVLTPSRDNSPRPTPIKKMPLRAPSFKEEHDTESGTLLPVAQIDSNWWSVLSVIIIDVCAGSVAFATTAVVYISTAHSVVGKLDPTLLYVVIDAALLGTGLAGAWMTLASRIPWCIASVDVGIAPLLAQMADVVWQNVVQAKSPITNQAYSFESEGPQVYDLVTVHERRQFVATFAVATALTFAWCGITLALVGQLKLSRIVEYLPWPVTSGMLASIGVSLFKSGAKVAYSGGYRVSTALGVSWFCLCLLVAYSSRQLKACKRIPTFLALPIVIFGYTLISRQVALAFGLQVDRQEALGLLFHWDEKMLASAKGWCAWTDISVVDSSNTNREQMLTQPVASYLLHALFSQDKISWKYFFKVRFWRRGLKYLLKNVNWRGVAACRGVALATVVIAALKLSMKAGSLAALFPMAEVNVNSELRQLGIAGNIFPACIGLAHGQAFSFSSLKIAQQFGATDKGAGLVAVALCIVSWILGFGSLKSVPRYVYGALLLDLGYDYIETYLLRPLQRGHNVVSSGEKCTVLAIVTLAAAASLLEAVAMGFVLCLFVTATRLASISIISAASTGVAARSTIERSARQSLALDDSGDTIVVLVLRGLLFFGSASELLDHIRCLHYGTKFLVLDLSRCVYTFDATAVAALEQIAEIGNHRGFSVLLAPDLPHLVHHLKNIKFFQDPDDALEYAEDAALASFLSPPINTTPLDQHQISRKRGISPTPQTLLQTWLQAAADDGLDPNDNTTAEIAAALAPLCNLSLTHFHAGEVVYECDHLVTHPAFNLVCAGRFRLLDSRGRCVRKVSIGHAVSVGAYYYDLRGVTTPTAATHMNLNSAMSEQKAQCTDESTTDTTTESDEDQFTTDNLFLDPLYDAATNLAACHSHTLQATMSPSTILKIPYTAVTALERANPAAAVGFHKIMARCLAIKNKNSLLAVRAASPHGDATVFDFLAHHTDHS